MGSDDAVTAFVRAVADGAGEVETGVGGCSCCVCTVGVDAWCAIGDGDVDMVKCCG